MVAEVAEERAFEPDTTVGKVVGSWAETEAAEHDLRMSEHTPYETDQPVKPVVLAGGIGID